MAHFGHYISGAGHVGLIGFVLIGPLFSSEPLPFDVSNVSIVTSEEFAALSTSTPSTPAVPQPDALSEPEVEETAPPAPEPEAPAPEEIAPAPTPEPEPETVPEVPAPPVPVEPPQEDVATIVAPDPVETPDLPELAPEVTQRPAERVAPEPVTPPEPDTTVADEVQEEVTPDPAAEAVVEQEPQEATAPEAAATEIVTEANEGQPAAPARSVRPAARPNRPVPQVAEAETPSTSTDDAVNAALQEALGNSDPAPAAPSGPPLTSGEREGLVVAVQDCWVVDVGSPAADVVVTVAMDMNRDGTVAGAVRLLSAEGGDGRAQDVAYQAARRAVLRCQKGGYDLPADKYEQWKEIEITFNPERMRVR